jgi:U3 small nucleolar RNA-associated protein 19
MHSTHLFLLYCTKQDPDAESDDEDMAAYDDADVSADVNTHYNSSSSSSKKRKQQHSTAAAAAEQPQRQVQRIRYHRKVFADAWLACLALPLPAALYKEVLLFLPGSVVPAMGIPLKLADFLTESYNQGGINRCDSTLTLALLF